MGKNRTFMNFDFYKNWVDRTFRHNRKDDEFQSWWRRGWLILKQSGIIMGESLFDSRVSLQAAAMTYYTLFMSVPFLALALVFSSEAVDLEDSLNTICSYILPSHPNAINNLVGDAHDLIDKLKTSFKGLTGIVIAMIAYYMWGFLVNLQHLINQSWNCEDRNLGGKLKFGLFIVIGALVTALLWAFSLKLAAGNMFLRILFSVVILFLAVFVVFYFLPNNRKVGFLPSLMGSLSFSIVLIATWSLLMIFPSRVQSYSAYPGLFFVLLLCFWSWDEFFMFAKLCSHWDKSDDKYLNKEVKKLAPFMEDYLSVYVMSFIVKSFNHSHKGVNIDEIRRGMFRRKDLTGQESLDMSEWRIMKLSELIDNSQKDSEMSRRDIMRSLFWKFRHMYIKGTSDEGALYAIKTTNEFGQEEYVVRPSEKEIRGVIKSLRKLGQTYLPNSILSEILRKLESRMLVDVYVDYQGGKMIKTYLPKGTSKAGSPQVIPVDSNSLTVGELLWKLKFDGDYDLKYNYLALNSSLTSNMISAYGDCYRSLDMKLSEMDFDMDVVSEETRTYNKKSMYDIYKNGMASSSESDGSQYGQSVDMDMYLQHLQDQYGGLDLSMIEEIINSLPPEDEMRIQFEMVKNMTSQVGEGTGAITS